MRETQHRQGWGNTICLRPRVLGTLTNAGEKRGEKLGWRQREVGVGEVRRPRLVSRGRLVSRHTGSNSILVSMWGGWEFLRRRTRPFWLA